MDRPWNWLCHLQPAFKEKRNKQQNWKYQAILHIILARVIEGNFVSVTHVLAHWHCGNTEYTAYCEAEPARFGSPLSRTFSATKGLQEWDGKSLENSVQRAEMTWYTWKESLWLLWGSQLGAQARAGGSLYQNSNSGVQRGETLISPLTIAFLLSLRFAFKQVRVTHSLVLLLPSGKWAVQEKLIFQKRLPGHKAWNSRKSCFCSLPTNILR